MGSTFTRRLRFYYYRAECPLCGASYVWLKPDLEKESHRCKACKQIVDTELWPQEETGEVVLVLSEFGAELISD